MDNYDIIEYPKSRVATFDVGKIGNKKHFITGLVEIDVSSARIKISEHIKSGIAISFTSWIIKIIGTTIYENKYIHAIDQGIPIVTG